MSTVVGNVLTVWRSVPTLAFLTSFKRPATSIIIIYTVYRSPCLGWPGFSHRLVGVNNCLDITLVLSYSAILPGNIYAIIICYYDKQWTVLVFDNNSCHQHWITGSDRVPLIADVFGQLFTVACYIAKPLYLMLCVFFKFIHVWPCCCVCFGRVGSMCLIGRLQSRNSG